MGVLVSIVYDRWRCELSGDVLDGGQWHERQAALDDLPHFTRVDEEQPFVAAASLDDRQLDSAADGLEEINIS